MLDVCSARLTRGDFFGIVKYGEGVYGKSIMEETDVLENILDDIHGHIPCRACR